MQLNEIQNDLYYKQDHIPIPEQKKEQPQQFTSNKTKIIQFADPNQTLPDGSKIVYAENDEKITLYKKKSGQKGIAYVYMRRTGDIFINGKQGDINDQRQMLQMGKYLLDHGKESDMVTITLN